MPPSPESNTPSDDSNEEKGSVSPIIGSTNINSVEKIGKKIFHIEVLFFLIIPMIDILKVFVTIFFIFFSASPQRRQARRAK